MVTTPSLRIVYFGTPAFATPTLRRLIGSKHTVVGLVSQPDRPKGRGQRLVATPTKELALLGGVPVFQPTKLKDEEFLDTMRALHADLGVVAAYGRILPDALLAIPRLGMINVHASLLPKYRGAAPVHRAVIAGETETGVTIMRVVRELDAGAMMAVRTRPIAPDETSVEVERDLADIGAALLLDVVDQLAEGRATETAQDDAQATYAPKIAKEDGVVDWTRPAVDIHNRVRGVQPWPLVSIRLAGLRYLLHRSAVMPETADAEPGTVIRASGDDLFIATGERGVLRVVQIQPEGRRTMTARELLAGHPIATGTRVDAP